MVHIGIRPQVVAVEQSSAEVAKNVEAPVVIVTGASRGIGKAIALAMGKAGCKVNDCIFLFSSPTAIIMIIYRHTFLIVICKCIFLILNLHGKME